MRLILLVGRLLEPWLDAIHHALTDLAKLSRGVLLGIQPSLDGYFRDRQSAEDFRRTFDFEGKFINQVTHALFLSQVVC